MLAGYMFIHGGYRLSRLAPAKLEEEIDKSVRCKEGLLQCIIIIIVVVSVVIVVVHGEWTVTSGGMNERCLMTKLPTND